MFVSRVCDTFCACASRGGGSRMWFNNRKGLLNLKEANFSFKRSTKKKISRYLQSTIESLKIALSFATKQKSNSNIA